MGIIVKASDLYYRYPKETTTRHLAKFSGKPDKARLWCIQMSAVRTCFAHRLLLTFV